RVDATHETGTAHAVRVRRLVQMLDTKPQVTIMGEDRELLGSFFPGYEVVAPGDYSKVSEIPTACLGDCPDMPSKFWHSIKDEYGVPTIALDDYGGAVHADLIVNGTVLDAYHKYSDLPDGGNVLCGSPYALIDPSFADTRWQSRPARRAVTIVAGGGDRAAGWIQALLDGDLNFGGWGEVELVVGASFPDSSETEKRATASGIRFSKAIPSSLLAARLSRSSVALITGGMIVYEGLCVGVPCVVFPQERNLIDEARWFETERCISNLGYDGGMDLPVIDRMVLDMIDDRQKAVGRSARGRALIDGQGMSRAATAIDGLISARLAGKI
ncbi:hypothetical protein OAA59_01800, partial [bacterium]|nr:hypothetical protein [bacterium]